MINSIKLNKAQFDNGEVVVFDPEEDIHMIAGLLKLYLRELPEPVIPDSIQGQLLGLVHIHIHVYMYIYIYIYLYMHKHIHTQTRMYI